MFLLRPIAQGYLTIKCGLLQQTGCDRADFCSTAEAPLLCGRFHEGAAVTLDERKLKSKKAAIARGLSLSFDSSTASHVQVNTSLLP
jgi:hypothetical protein